MSAVNEQWRPVLPYELVDATEHHGPYVCTVFGTTVCDFYAMSNPSGYSFRNGGDSKPISFTEAAENASFMVKAANAHDELVAGLRAIEQKLDYGQILTALAMTRSLLAKHGGAS